MTLPNPLYAPPTIKINKPISATIEEIIMIRFMGISLSSTVINCETNTELKKIATNNDEPKTTESVIGK